MTARPHWQAWYKTAGWRKRRAYQLKQHPLCQECEKLGRIVPATVADHVEPHRGDPEKFWNGTLQSLCKPCHDRHKQSEEKGGLGFRRGCDVDGRPLDPGHHWSRPSL